MAIYAIMGKSASGKDTLLRNLLDTGYSSIIPYTTRPMRDGEKEGVTYHFVSENDFLEKIKSEFFAEHRSYETAHGLWRYGTAKRDCHSEKVVISTLDGVRKLRENGMSVTAIYLDCCDDVRLARSNSRKDDLAEQKRRLQADNDDYPANLVHMIADYVVDSSRTEKDTYYHVNNILQLDKHLKEDDDYAVDEQIVEFFKEQRLNNKKL